MKKFLLIFIPIISVVVLGTAAYFLLFSGNGLLAGMLKKPDYTHKVTWVDEYNNILQVDENVEAGVKPTYNGVIPTKEEDEDYYYDFGGWTEKADGSVAITADGVNVTNIICVPYFNEIRKIHYIYEDADGTILQETIGKETNTDYPKYIGTVTPSLPAANGYHYVFTGWELPEDNWSEIIFRPMFISLRDSFIVTFRNVNGTTFKKYTAYYGDSLEQIYQQVGIPTKANSNGYKYIFEGWNPNVDDDYVYQNITCTPIFDEQLITHQVSFDLDGGSTSSSTDPIYITNLNCNNFFFNVTKSSYRFCGWSYNGIQVFDERGEIINSIDFDEEMTFKAIFLQKAKITVHFDITAPNAVYLSYGLESKYGTGFATGLYDYNSTINVSINLKDGYVFEGWYSEMGDKLSDVPSFDYQVLEEDVVIDCRFAYAPHTINVTTNNAQAGLVSATAAGFVSPIIYGTDMESIVVNNRYSQAMTLKATPLIDASFLGWFDSANNQLCDLLEYSFTMPNSDLSITAKWDYYSVSYDLDGGTNNANNITGYKSSDASFTLLPPTKEGHTFTGWTMNGLPVTTIDPTSEMNYRLVANWTYYTVSTFINHPSLGNFTMLDQTLVTCGDSVTLSATSKNNSTFDGWYLGDELVCEDLSYTFTMTAVNQTYEARFVIPEGFENLLFNVVDEDIIVIGIIDRMVTEIIIPDSVTTILEGALSGCSNLAYLSLPFIGKEQHLAGEARLETNEYLLGYIFGYNPYSNSVSVMQSYKEDGDIVDMRYQIPSTLRTVVLRGGNRIGYYAFQNCSMLENIYIPSTITHIDEVAFFGCSGLTSFTFPTGLLEIGNSAFYLCTSLEEVTLPNTLTALGYNAFTNCSSLATLNYVDDSVILGNNVFTGTAIQNANISTNIISIMTKTNLVNLTIHGSTIPTNAFSSCNNLTNVTLIDVITIETNAFLSCYSLEKVIVNSVEDWCNITFVSTSSNPLYYAHELYIGDELLTDIVIPDTITTLHNYVFTQGTSFKSIVIPNSVVEIGLDILNGCNALESVTIPFVGFTRPNSENVSDQRPFGHLFGTNQNRGDICQHWPSNSSVDYWYVIPESLKTVTVTDSTYIPDYAFQNCRMIVNINLPNEVTYIGQQAFRSCTNLSQFILPSDIDTIGSHAFLECYRLVEVVNHSSKSLTLNADSNGYIAYYAEGIISDEANSLLTTTEDGFVIYNGTILVNYLGSEEDLFIDSPITEIHNFAFMYNKIIEIVTLCDAITAIGKYAFFQCSSLEEINIPYQVTEIKESTFDLCDKLSVIAIEGVVTRIEQKAFRYVIVEEIDLDNGLEYIGNSAFANSQISTINYHGTIAEWNLISKSEDWNNASCLSTISCTDGCILL